MSTKKEILNRYGRDSEGGIVIDVAAGGVEDLYDNFDRHAPYIRRDLDQDLVDYLIECGRELGPEPFSISFALARHPDEKRQSRVGRSIGVYFRYLIEIERKEIRRMFRRSFILMVTGLVILFLSVRVNQMPVASETVVGSVFAEGLTIAAWVSLWEALATLMLEWSPHRREIRIFRRLSQAPLLFRSRNEASPDDTWTGSAVTGHVASQPGGQAV